MNINFLQKTIKRLGSNKHFFASIHELAHLYIILLLSPIEMKAEYLLVPRNLYDGVSPHVSVVPTNPEKDEVEPKNSQAYYDDYIKMLMHFDAGNIGSMEGAALLDSHKLLKLEDLYLNGYSILLGNSGDISCFDRYLLEFNSVNRDINYFSIVRKEVTESVSKILTYNEYFRNFYSSVFKQMEKKKYFNNENSLYLSEDQIQGLSKIISKTHREESLLAMERLKSLLIEKDLIKSYESISNG